MHIRSIALATIVLSSPVLATPTDPLHWNRFRGPDGLGIAPDEQALPAHLDPERNLVWKRELPPGHSSPCLAGDRIFLTGATEEELLSLCIDRASGEVLWQRVLPAKAIERLHPTNGPASPTPTADSERVMVYFGAFGLICYDHDGKELWRRELPIPDNTFGPAASPVLAGEYLVFVNDSDGASYVEALRPATGETVWRKERTGFGSGWSTPALWRRGEVDELLVYGVWWLTAYNLRDGSERWSVPGLSDEPIVTPVTGDDLVFVSSYNMKTSPEVIGLPTFADLLARHDADGDEKLDRKEAEGNASILSRHDADGEGDHPLLMFFRYLDVDEDGEITELEWGKVVRWVDGFAHANGLMAIRPGAEGKEPAIVWQHPRGVPESPSPLYYRGRIYTVMNGGLATCIDARTGEVKYEGRLDSRGPCYASPVAGDGKLYSASARGVVTVFRAGDVLEVLSRNDLGERIMATPALEGGRVYVRTERSLYAFGPPSAERDE